MHGINVNDCQNSLRWTVFFSLSLHFRFLLVLLPAPNKLVMCERHPHWNGSYHRNGRAHEKICRAFKERKICIWPTFDTLFIFFHFGCCFAFTHHAVEPVDHCSSVAEFKMTYIFLFKSIISPFCYTFFFRIKISSYTHKSAFKC